ncbi:radical SAM protein [Syntrophus buswellii]|uniref:FeMo cofactor biosynthesis protein NifB n=1 Tax=Syntrophorhabdus aromaticivorans TaxID=328301 RepID=A0A971M656_9BACT|nr:radical SAM protein [Syntrophorhabdus aromaticivorans]
MTLTGLCERRSLLDHPCFYRSAGTRWGRVHLPVAPNCTIQCNFCNRLYDCVNESRPGVTSRILDPAEALLYLDRLLKARSDISVVGIAGPGDSLCDPERTLETMRAVHAAYPDLLLCLSTNGLNLAEHVDDLVAAGVTHITVTVNAVDPLIGQRIYAWVSINSMIYRGLEAAQLLLSRQEEAMSRLKGRGLTVKINSVVVPGINAGHITAIAEKAAEWGVDLMNCIPMIPVQDTPFECLGAPADAEMVRIRALASLHLPQMYHCRRCRADAVGLLCSEKS